MQPGSNTRKKRLSFKNIKTFESFKIPAYRILFLSHIGQWAVGSMAISLSAVSIGLYFFFPKLRKLE